MERKASPLQGPDHLPGPEGRQARRRAAWSTTVIFSQPALEGHHRDVVRPDEAVLYAPIDVILSDTSSVQSDIVYLDTARLGRISRRGIEGAPTLVVEILSPSTGLIDRRTKRQLYARHGVRSPPPRPGPNPGSCETTASGPTFAPLTSMLSTLTTSTSASPVTPLMEPRTAAS